MKKLLLISMLVSLFGLCSCQYCTRQFGGETTINLKKGEKLVEVTWKDANLWYLTEPMEDDYIPKTKVFKENSNAGMLEGKVTFIETR